MKNNPDQVIYRNARMNLLLMMLLTAVNVALALLGEDTYYLFTNYLAYLLGVYAAAFYSISGDSAYIVVGIVLPLLVLLPYFLCWLLSKKRRGWMIAALVLFSLDTALLLLDALTDFAAANLLDIVIHGLMLFYLIRGVIHSRAALSEEPTPEALPDNTDFYDASMEEQPDSRPLGEPVEKYRLLVSATWGSHVIEARRSRGLTELVIDGKVYGRQEGVIEIEYRIEARLGGHVIATEFRSNGKQLLLVDQEVIAKKQRLF